MSFAPVLMQLRGNCKRRTLASPTDGEVALNEFQVELSQDPALALSFACNRLQVTTEMFSRFYEPLVEPVLFKAESIRDLQRQKVPHQRGRPCSKRTRRKVTVHQFQKSPQHRAALPRRDYLTFHNTLIEIPRLGDCGGNQLSALSHDLADYLPGVKIGVLFLWADF